MEIKIQKIADLEHDAHNARKHPESQLSALKESLRRFGQAKPIVITSAGVVVAGNGTLEAARELGWTEIETVEIPAHWDAATTKAFALADNRTAELAQWDARELLSQLEELDEFDMQALGFDAWKQEEDTATSEGNSPESRGLGNPIISFEIIFDDHAQQDKWFEFLKFARIAHPEAETNAERIVAAITDFMNEPLFEDN